MEVLWPGCEPQLANNNLKAAVRALRQTLSLPHGLSEDFGWVLFHDGNYMINSQADVWVDTEQFESHWNLGWRLEKEGRISEAIAEYRSAESLYRGEFLEEDPYEDWTLLTRESVKDIYFSILSKLGDYYMESGDYENTIGYCHKIIAKDPCREDAYRRLMCAYVKLGNRNRALHWYKICERTIKAELDLPPDPQTVELYHKLLNDEPL